MAAVFAGLIAAGCATFKSPMKGVPASPPSRNFGADRVSVMFVFSHYRQTRGLDAIPKLEGPHERIRGFDDFFQDALKEFGNIRDYATYTEYASDVNDPARRAMKDSLMARHDYVVKMTFMRTRSFSRYFLGSLASTVTLTALPLPYTASYSVTADVFDRGGRLIRTYARGATLTKWVQGLLVFLYPFHPEQRKKEELYVQFMHDLFRQIETERILERPAS